jgi:hypothetical protein
MIDVSDNKSTYSKWWIGWIIILFLTSGYQYLSKPVSRSELNILKGTLKTLPKFGSTGGDFPYYYMQFQLNEYEHTILINQCAYKALNMSEVSNLAVGDSIQLEVKELDEKWRAFGIQAGGADILAYHQYVRCENESWKSLFYLGLICFAAFVLSLVYKKRKNKK